MMSVKNDEVLRALIPVFRLCQRIDYNPLKLVALIYGLMKDSEMVPADDIRKVLACLLVDICHTNEQAHLTLEAEWQLRKGN